MDGCPGVGPNSAILLVKNLLHIMKVIYSDLMCSVYSPELVFLGSTDHSTSLEEGWNTHISIWKIVLIAMNSIFCVYFNLVGIIETQSRFHLAYTHPQTLILQKPILL